MGISTHAKGAAGSGTPKTTHETQKAGRSQRAGSTRKAHISDQNVIYSNIQNTMLSKNADSGVQCSWLYILISIGDNYLKVWVFGKRKGYSVVISQ